jgi:hypothetical protein
VSGLLIGLSPFVLRETTIPAALISTGASPSRRMCLVAVDRLKCWCRLIGLSPFVSLKLLYPAFRLGFSRPEWFDFLVTTSLLRVARRQPWQVQVSTL